VGVKSANTIVMARRFGKLGTADLKKIGVVMKKAQYFITCKELAIRTVHETSPEYVRRKLTGKKPDSSQLEIQFDW